MCTALIFHQPGHTWPLLLAANRDEMLSRPWQPPGEHWPELPGVVGGRDGLAGGTWLALSHHGVVAAVLNRPGTLGPTAGQRSRGELPLAAARYSSARAAVDTLAALDGRLYRGFNLLVADPVTAWFIRGSGEGQVDVLALPAGLHMVTSADPNDSSHPRVSRHLPRFAAVAAPSPPDWGAWPDLLADSDGAWAESLNVPPREGFGTTSAALIGVAPGRSGFWFAAGRPSDCRFRPVSRATGGCYSGGLTQTAPAPAVGGV
jgi:hypothetical protein